MITALDGKRQIRVGTIDLGRLETNFLKGQDWDINSGSLTPATITGVPNPEANLDVVNKQYVDNIVAGGSGIGISSAEDGSYADGLFSDFTPITTVGTAVDRFNEVLKALAPSPAPNLSNVTSSTNGAAGKLSFDATHVIAGLTVHPSQLINSSYSTSGAVRGIINASTNVTATLANNIAPSYANSRPYPNHAFGDGDKGNLVLELNGTVVHTTDLSTFASGNSFNAQGSGFNLTSVDSVKFDNGNVLDLFKYRTGSVIINSASMRPGYNTVRVRHEYATGLYRDTGSIAWIVDNDTTATSFNTPVLNQLALTGTKYLSGVKYHTGGSAKYSVTISNAYKYTYSASASAIAFNGTNCSASAMSLPDMVNYTDIVVVTDRAVTISATRLYNQSFSLTSSVLRSVQATQTSTSVLIDNILLDNVSDDSTSANETFNGEAYRIHSSVVLTNTSYGAGGAGASGYTWDSTQNLVSGDANHNTGLLVSAGELTYPKVTSHAPGVVNGNFGAVVNGYAGNPDYSVATGNRTYLRYFYTSAAKSNFRLNVTATNTTFVSVATGASGNNLTLEILAPNTTVNSGGSVVWKDAVTSHSGNDADVGCYAATFGNSRPTNWGLTLGTKNTSTSGGVVVVRVTAGAGWTGKVSSIALTWL